MSEKPASQIPAQTRVRKAGLSIARPAPLHYRSVVAVRERFALSRGEVEQLFGISVRSQYRYDSSDPPLAPAIADRVERFERIYRQAVALFEDEPEAQRWLGAPKATLDGQAPLALLTTDQGARKVEQVLYQAEYGIFG